MRLPPQNNNLKKKSFFFSFSSSFFGSMTVEVYDSCARGDLQTFIAAVKSDYEVQSFELAIAAYNGHIAFFEWIENTFLVDWVSFTNIHPLTYQLLTDWKLYTLDDALCGRQTELVKYCLLLKCPWTPRSLYCAVLSNSIELVRFCIHEGAPCNALAVETAARQGNFKMVKLLHDTFKTNITSDILVGAILSGSVPVLSYLLKSRCTLYAFMCALAAQYGKLPILKCLKEHGCDWDESVVFCAANYNQKHVLKWLLANNAPVNQHDQLLVNMLCEQL